MALLARLACILMLVLLGACAGTEPAQVSSSDADDHDEKIDEINRAWEEFRFAMNDCQATDGECLVDGLASSGLEEAVADL